MRLAEIIPVTNLPEREFEDEKAYLSHFVSSDVELDIYAVDEGVKSLESEIHSAIATKGIIAKCIELEKKGYDGIFVSCFDDPGIKAARECIKIPIIGGGESSLSIALNLADRVTIIAPSENSIPSTIQKVRLYGLNDRVASVRSVNVYILDIKTQKSLSQNIVETILKAVLEDGTQAIVLGCTAMVSIVDNIRKILNKEGLDIPVIEPASVCISLLETIVRCKLNQSRITYPFVENGYELLK